MSARAVWQRGLLNDSHGGLQQLGLLLGGLLFGLLLGPRKYAPLRPRTTRMIDEPTGDVAASFICGAEWKGAAGSPLRTVPLGGRLGVRMHAARHLLAYSELSSHDKPAPGVERPTSPAS